MAKTEAVSANRTNDSKASHADEVGKSKFHMEEYKSLRAEILVLKQHQFTILKWTVVSLGIIYGLAFGVTGEKTIQLLPKIDGVILVGAGLLLSITAAGLYSVTDFTMRKIAEYLIEIESHFAGDKIPKGWEHFQPFYTEGKPVWGVLRNPFWWGILFVSIVLAPVLYVLDASGWLPKQ